MFECKVLMLSSRQLNCRGFPLVILKQEQVQYDMDINKLAKRIEGYLQDDADEWITSTTDNAIHCYWSNILRFTITFDDDEVFISGTDICLDTLYDIKEIIDKTKSVEKKIT